MKKRILMAMFAAMMTVGTMSPALTVNAATPAAQAQAAPVVKQKLNATVISKVFDAKYYAAMNPDVAAVTTDPAKLLEHYMNFGIYEGRAASENFNASIYALANPDLLQAFGDNLEAMVEHYVNFGVNEKRVASEAQFVTMDPTARAAAVSTSTEFVKTNEGNSSYDYVMSTGKSSDDVDFYNKEEKFAFYHGCKPEDMIRDYESGNNTYDKWDLVQAYAAKNMWYDPTTDKVLPYGEIYYDDEVDEWGGRFGHGTSLAGTDVEVYNISDEGFAARAKSMGYVETSPNHWEPASDSSNGSSDSGSSSSDSGASSSDTGSSSSGDSGSVCYEDDFFD